MGAPLPPAPSYEAVRGQKAPALLAAPLPRSTRPTLLRCPPTAWAQVGGPWLKRPSTLPWASLWFPPCRPPASSRVLALSALYTAVGMNHTSGALFDLSLVQGGMEADAAKNALLYGPGAAQEGGARDARSCSLPSEIYQQIWTCHCLMKQNCFHQAFCQASAQCLLPLAHKPVLPFPLLAAQT